MMVLGKRGLIAAALLLALSAAASLAADEKKHTPGSQEVETTGEGTTLEEARKRSQRTAIEQVLGSFLTSKTLTENAALVEDKILSKAGGFAVLKKKPEPKSSQDDDVWTFTGTWVVSAVPMAQLLKESGLVREWRVLVIIPEWHIQRPVPDPAAETEFINQFVKAGFKVIDQKRYAELRQQNADRLKKDPKVAAEIARKLGADVVITGEAFSEEAGEAVAGSGLQTCRARVEVRALLADTAEILSADATEGPGVDLTAAVAGKKALQQTAKKLAPQFIADILLLPASDTRKLQLEVSIFKSFTQAARFQKAVEALPGINKVTRESYDEGVLVLDIDADIDSAEALAEKLEEAETMKPFGLQVGGVSKTRVRATLGDD